MKCFPDILAIAVGAVLLTCWAAPARPQTVPDQRPSVVLSPQFHVFGDIKGQRADLAPTRALYRGAAEFVAHHPDQLYTVTRSDLIGAVKSTRGFDYKLKAARVASDFGIDKYKTLEIQKAQLQLEDALQSYESFNYGLAKPERVAEVVLYLALSYIEQNVKTLKLFNLLQKMLLLDPSRRIRQGYYPDEVVRVYRDARQSLIEVLREEGPDRSDAAHLASFADTDFAVYGYAWPTDKGAYQVALYLYSTRDERFLKPEMLQVDTLAPDVLREAGNRLMSRYLPRLKDPIDPSEAPMVDTRGKSPFSMQFGAAYASFFQYPESLDQTKPWGNLGMAISARLMLTRGFTVVAGVHFLNSMSDFAGLLASDFITFRGFVGGDMGIDLGSFNLGLQVGAEASSIEDFQVYADKLCAAGRRDCGKRWVDNSSLMVGINIRPRLIWHAYRQFSLIGSLGGTYFVLPLAGRNFNFPITGRMDVSYQF